MAFRDETEALRQRVRTLNDALDAARRERNALVEATRELGQGVEARAKELDSGISLVTVMVGVALAGVAVGGFVAGASGSSSRTYYGRVVSVSGEAPVPEGARCTTFISESDSDDHRSKISVLCNGRLIYGGESLGYVGCDEDDGVITRCEDEEFTGGNGDPKMTFDSAGGTIRVEDAPPAWTVAITFGGAQP